jgi:hypothetical protein
MLRESVILRFKLKMNEIGIVEGSGELTRKATIRKFLIVRTEENRDIHGNIRTLNPNDPADIARHDRMVMLVTQMLDLNKRLQDARLEQEKTQLSRQIEATDAAIDKLVYELYGLTPEEIAIVEGSGK